MILCEWMNSVGVQLMVIFFGAVEFSELFFGISLVEYYYKPRGVGVWVGISAL